MATVYANNRGIVHKGSGGMSTVMPDVCKTPTPGGPIPIPYPNIGMASNVSGGPSTVTTDGQMPAAKDAKYTMSTGDEAGSIGGIMSGVIKGECEFMMYSFDVKLDGKNACRLGDPMWQNKKNIMG